MKLRARTTPFLGWPKNLEKLPARRPEGEESNIFMRDSARPQHCREMERLLVLNPGYERPGDRHVPAERGRLSLSPRAVKVCDGAFRGAAGLRRAV